MTANAAANIAGRNFRLARRLAFTLLLLRKLAACRTLSNAMFDCERVMPNFPVRHEALRNMIASKKVR